MIDQFKHCFISSLMALTAMTFPCLSGQEELKFYSQLGQDRFMYNNFFKDKRDGFFVDIGAHDGVTYSNSYFFEKNLNWTGICVEPIGDIFAQLQLNRKALCIQGCIYDRSGSVNFLHVKGAPEMLSGILEDYDPRHLERIRREIEQDGGSLETIPVQAYLLNDILEAVGVFYVDYLSMDIEGGELKVLKSIDYDKFFIDVIDVENNYNDPEIYLFLTSKGYQFIQKLDCDEVYKKISP